VSQCEDYGVTFLSGTVVKACRAGEDGLFAVEMSEGEQFLARKILMATGMQDEVPNVDGFHDFYGTSIHHCPYCDGWEHRDQQLVAFGKGKSAAKLAVTLYNWSKHVICCSDGEPVDRSHAHQLACLGIEHRPERVVELRGTGRQIAEVVFATGDAARCDALFFSAGQAQRCRLPEMLGCECDENGLLLVKDKQGSGVRGLFLAGDAEGDVQFVIVAAAEGAIAATAINAELLEEDIGTLRTDGGDRRLRNSRSEAKNV
jgi:thioredoxin reductase